MRRPALRAVALAVLVVTAGCSGFASSPQADGDATTTAPEQATSTEEVAATDRTTAPEETTTTAESETDAELAPGLTERGVEDAMALVGAHRERLGGESLTIDALTVERYENGTVRNESRQTTRTAANRTRYRILVNTTAPNGITGADGEGELWANGTHVFHARETNGTTNYSLFFDARSEPADTRDYLRGDLTSSDRLLVLFTAFESERVERVDDGNAAAPERYRVTASDLAHPDFVADGSAVENATLEAVIESDGPDSAFVREYAVRYETEIDGETVRVTERIEHSDIGETTVERPEWFDGETNATE